ncbi:GNAT family N-acetyltransferase [Paenisporosarcina sp. TG20]|uniref:GNAT family N-acetyltransferase n=1 Tax=Paenisporosarcina sp. TG20 TaxID=1211706 RepID=UPI0002DF2B7F|nr:GNAT family N-acetyltransferase [Paenisporosarcina sp. TG20]
MSISIVQLQDIDIEDLFEFELENRGFFEEMVPTRGDDYYILNTFRKKHEALLEEQTQGISYFYLIKDIRSSIIGRMNLVYIDENQKLGHIGYRVGQAHIGKGVANNALKLLLETMIVKDLKQIKAKTTTTNIASQKVLEKNGFKFIECSDEEFEMNGQKLKFIHYIWTK